MTDAVRFGAFLVIFLLMLCWEWIRPFRSFRQSKLNRITLNVGLMGLNFAVVRIFGAGGAMLVADYSEKQGLGLFNIVSVPEWLATVLSLILLDLAIYLQHRLFHKIPLFWRIHRVHHSDIGFDSSTAVRFHPVEILLSMYYKMIIVIAFGISSGSVICFEIILNGCALFNHGNVRIPKPWDNYLRWLLITPDMHRIHHSIKRSETDSNYGFSVTWWDRLFRTYCHDPALGQKGMEIGISAERNPKKLQFLRLLKLPLENPG